VLEPGRLVVWALPVVPRCDHRTQRRMVDTTFAIVAPMARVEVEKVIDEMARSDPEAAEDARSLFEWLAGDGDENEITLSRLLRFAWYDLSVKWLMTDSDRRSVLAAGATLFAALGLDSYAAALGSAQTLDILAAHERGYDEGLRAFQKAFDAAGISPPDLDDFAWGDMMSSEENAAHIAAEHALEQAIDDGSMIPGTSGWRSEAKAVTAAVLEEPHPELPGQSWRTAIMTERIYSHIRMLEGRAPGLHTLLSQAANRLLHPIPPPSHLDSHLETVTWFFAWIGDGIQLTGAGYLPTAMVRSGAERFGWDKGWSSDPPQKESDSRELMALHEFLRDAGAIRHRTGSAKVTAIGKRMMGDPTYTWRSLAASLGWDEWSSAVTEVYALLLLLLLDSKNDQDSVNEAATELLGESGWRATDGPLVEWNVSHTWFRIQDRVDVLGGFVDRSRSGRRAITMTPFGEATLLEFLRVRTIRPMRRR